MITKYFENIYKIEVPVPFPIKTINVYLISKNPTTLIDTGLKTEESFEVLSRGLKELGSSIESINRILITHGHIDHYGLAKKISTLSGAQIYIHPKEYGRIRSFIHQFGYLKTILIRNGVPTNLAEGIIKYFESGQKYCDSIEDAFFLNDGDPIPFNSMEIRTIHCPGHSPGLICLYYPDKGLLFTSDHLLKEITPNPTLNPVGTTPPFNYPSLKEYLVSLEKIDKLKISLALPGHGAEIVQPKELIKQIFSHHKERMNSILHLLSKREMSPFEIAKDIFPDLSLFEVFLGVSEILGHLYILLEKGLVRVKEKYGKDYYSFER